MADSSMNVSEWGLIINDELRQQKTMSMYL